jgi:hypothetical protein
MKTYINGIKAEKQDIDLLVFNLKTKNLTYSVMFENGTKYITTNY